MQNCQTHKTLCNILVRSGVQYAVFDSISAIYKKKGWEIRNLSVLFGQFHRGLFNNQLPFDIISESFLPWLIDQKSINC